MRARALVVITAAGVIAFAPALTWAQTDRSLRTPEDFKKQITNVKKRSQEIFIEAGKVIQHQRCLNCHPKGNRPFQDNRAPHQPPVERGDAHGPGHGAPAMRCATCHRERNFDAGRVPGAPQWALAPIEMAWQDLSLARICAQLKDFEKNGRKTLPGIVRHMSYDPLVGWAWNPGAGREPAPGTQAAFGALIAAWVKYGAVCPDD